ncbi:putative SAC1-recessive suppressor of secretory defect [Violaceomyces palustris]|uniref:SAC1-recessive suppressor of secretory defect n=1 Tax=Violaceomyces palustris TaxID=1673888 RepID=A0ACD0NSN2_9BASI|nr:putative SAC1-recessive suppressor of secretory defect [Violaceomyces palustris]
MPSSSSSNPQPLLWDELKMYISSDSYVFEPTSPGHAQEVLTVDRVSRALKLQANGQVDSSKKEKVMTIYGILGFISLHTTEFLVVISSRSKVATLLGSEIYLATDFRVFPVNSDASPHLLHHPIEKGLLALIKAHLYSAPFYFSYAYDITSSMQRQSQLEAKGLPMWKRADERFFWNRYLQSRMIDHTTTNPSQDLSRFILPCMFGFLEIKTSTINGRDFLFGLIARRSRHRTGTRYFSRGIDKDGNVSNYNETEQLVVLDPKDEADRIGKIDGKIRMSYLQTRGSVPVYWAEVNNLRYKPDLQIMDKPGTAEATKKHFDDQVERYGDIYLVNLVNQKGYEKPVKEAYEKAVDALGNPQVHYTYYDFHHECKGMKFERVMDLISRLNQKGHESDDYFFRDEGRQGDRRVVRRQKSVVRTNCMDCLDRTNVVQCTLGRWVLNDQLRAVGVLSADERVEDKADFMHMFRNVWADHADVISKAYSGTGALKTDFTRTGKRSKEGALQDGINSVTRYIKNNFFDGQRQDAYDLFTGAWDPSKGVPHVDRRALTIRAMPWVLFFSLFMLFCCLVLPRESGGTAHSAVETKSTTSSTLSFKAFTLIWIGAAIFSAQFMIARGLEYVAWPTLNRPEEAMFYEGPGFSSGKKGRLATSNPRRANGVADQETYANGQPRPKEIVARTSRRGGDYHRKNE